MSPGWQPKPHFSNSAPRLRPAELIRFLQHCLALGLWRTRARVFLQSFRVVLLTRRRRAVPTSRLSRLGSIPPWRYQNMALASSAVSVLSATPRLPRGLRFTVDITPSGLMVAWSSLTLVPHRPSSDATYWISYSRWGQLPSRASENALVVPGVVLASLLICKLRRASV